MTTDANEEAPVGVLRARANAFAKNHRLSEDAAGALAALFYEAFEEGRSFEAALSIIKEPAPRKGFWAEVFG